MGYLFGQLRNINSHLSNGLLPLTTLSENEFEAAEVHAIWEPPQVVDAHGPVELEGRLDTALQMAQFLGMTCVGWVFTQARPRDMTQMLSAREVYTAAALQKRFGNKFCTLVGFSFLISLFILYFTITSSWLFVFP